MAERQLMQAHLAVVGKVAGVGYISDMTFGVSPEDPAAREQAPGVSVFSVRVLCLADIDLDFADSEGARVGGAAGMREGGIHSQPAKGASICGCYEKLVNPGLLLVPPATAKKAKV